MKRFHMLLGAIALIGVNSATAADGKAVYTQVCRACHATGVANAPVLGDRKAWKSRISAGLPALQESALRGKGGMPPKGGHPGLTDDQVRAAVAYMVGQSQ